MKVSVISYDLSHNCLGRAYLLAKLVEQNHEVEVLGPTLGDGIWNPVKDEFEYKSFGDSSGLRSSKNVLEKSIRMVTGDVVYASKPRMSSFGVGLVNSKHKDIPLILDIDDWETGFKHELFGTYHRYILGMKDIFDLNSFYYTKALENLSPVADAVTVSNSFLQNKYGGTIIPHVRDTKQFNPNRYDKQSVRSELGLPIDETLVMFSGTPLPHKGVHHLVEIVKELPIDDVMTVVVGADSSEYTKTLSKIGGESVILKGQQPFEDIPKWISAADVIAVPQLSSASNGQIPAKVFDAMAMGKPIVATDMSDIDQIVGDCGIVVDSESQSELSDAIKYLIQNPAQAQELGEMAREKSVEKYSYKAAAPIVDRVIREAAEVSSTESKQ